MAYDAGLSPGRCGSIPFQPHGYHGAAAPGCITGARLCTSGAHCKAPPPPPPPGRYVCHLSLPIGHALGMNACWHERRHSLSFSLSLSLSLSHSHSLSLSTHTHTHTHTLIPSLTRQGCLSPLATRPEAQLLWFCRPRTLRWWLSTQLRACCYSDIDAALPTRYDIWVWA